MKSVVQVLLTIFGAFFIVPPCGVGILLSVILYKTAHSDTGQLTAAAGICLGSFIIAGLIRVCSNPGALRNISYITASSTGILTIVLLVQAYTKTPDGIHRPGASLESHWAGDAGYVRSSLANLVPEIDQFTLGAYLVPKLDPYIDEEKSVRIRTLFETVYLEMRKDADFVQVGSVMNYAYRDLFTFPSDNQHHYLYVPEHDVDDGKLPVLLFLHGSAGNFKGYTWVLKAFADQHRVAIFAPSFGFGNWLRSEGLARVEQAIATIQADPRLDESRMILSGLSNGGLGVTRAAGLNCWQAIVYFSGVMEPNGLQGFGTRCHAPVFVIHGAEDARIPQAYIEHAVSNIRASKVKVTLHMIPGEDHFLFFSRRDLVVELLRTVATQVVQSPKTP